MELDVFPTMQVVKETMIYLGLSAARMLGLVSILPVFKRTELGRSILGVIALAMALPVMGALRPDLAALNLDEIWYLAGIAIKEFGVGALIGLFFGIPIWAVQAGGEMIDTQRSITGQSGLSDSASGGEQSSVMSALLGLAAITIFVTEGGLGLAISTLYGSYAVWEVQTFLPGDMTTNGLSQIGTIIGQVILSGLLLAAPFLILFLLSDISAMVLGRLVGRVDMTGLLPLFKNVVFGVVAILYIQILVGYIGKDLGETRHIGRLLEILAGR